MSKIELTTVFENYDDVELIKYCIENRKNFAYLDNCVTIDESTGDVDSQSCPDRFEDLIDWFCEFYDTDIDSLESGVFPEPEGNSYTSAYYTKDGTLILIQNHPL